jgi:hypothetical protein
MAERKQKNQLFVGSLTKKESKEGKVFFTGYFGNVPVVALVGKKDPDKLHLILDVDRINYKRGHDNANNG